MSPAELDWALYQVARGEKPEALAPGLIYAGADPAAEDSRALKAAVARRRPALVRLFLENGADAKAGGGELIRELRARFAYGGPVQPADLAEMYQALLGAGDIAPTHRRRGPLSQEALDTALQDVARGLIQAENASSLAPGLIHAGASARANESFALRAAIAHKQSRLVELLLEAGADARAGHDAPMRILIGGINHQRGPSESDYRMARALIDAGAIVPADVQSPLDMDQDGHGQSPAG